MIEQGLTFEDHERLGERLKAILSDPDAMAYQRNSSAQRRRKKIKPV